MLSEVEYPGWQVWVDGKPGQVVTVAGLLRGVKSVAGQHIIKFIFRPWIVYIGIAIFLITWASILSMTFFTSRRIKSEK